jgi:hypothetical protein
MTECVISRQIAEHCDDEDTACPIPDCDGELVDQYSPGLGEYVECLECGHNTALDE